MVGIYKITNKINNKIYIGQSINISERWRAHRSRPFQVNASQYDSPLYRAIRKYGLGNFTFEVIEECNEEELNLKEQFYIQKYKSYETNHGYNLTMGGQTATTPSKITEDELEKIYDLLMDSDLTQEEIASKFSISQRLVSGINLGQYKMKQGYTYPLYSYRKLKEKKKYFCPKCGKEITYRAKLCVSCNSLSHRVAERPSKEELKRKIRDQSFLSIGKEYGVSDNSIRKWCKSYGLPSKKSEIKKISDEDWSKI